MAADSSWPSFQRERRCDKREGISPMATAPSRTCCVRVRESECNYFGQADASSTLLTNMIAHRQDMVSSTRIGVASSCCAVLISAATAASSPARLEKMFSQHNFSQGTRNGRIFFAAAACFVKRSCAKESVKKPDQRSHVLQSHPLLLQQDLSGAASAGMRRGTARKKYYERNTRKSPTAVLDLFEP